MLESKGYGEDKLSLTLMKIRQEIIDRNSLMPKGMNLRCPFHGTVFDSQCGICEDHRPKYTGCERCDAPRCFTCKGTTSHAEWCEVR